MLMGTDEQLESAGEMDPSSPRDVTNLERELERWQNVSAHESTRIKKAAERSQQLIKSRIKYLAREEDKQWRTLEDVRRRAVIIEDGRQRYAEKKVAQRQIQVTKERDIVIKQEAVNHAVIQKRESVQRVREGRAQRLDEKRLLTRQKRAWSEDIIRNRREDEQREVVVKQDQASAIQKDRVEAWLQVCREKADFIARLRSEKEAHRQLALQEAKVEEDKLQDLETEESKWLDRLKNSRTATQAALAELEHTFGSSSSLQTALKLKKQSSLLDQAKLLNGEGPSALGMLKSGETTPRGRNSTGSAYAAMTSPRSARISPHSNHSRDCDPFAPPTPSTRKRQSSGAQSPKHPNGVAPSPKNGYAPGYAPPGYAPRQIEKVRDRFETAEEGNVLTGHVMSGDMSARDLP